jgi:hypothetical protein
MNFFRTQVTIAIGTTDHCGCGARAKKAPALIHATIAIHFYTSSFYARNVRQYSPLSE